MNKKGQSISINTIIIAVLALGVLVVLFYIFTGRIGTFSEGVSKTASCENSCKSLNMNKDDSSTDKACTSPNAYVPGTYSDVGQGRVCCCTPKT